MSRVVALASAKGSPGVTTAAVALGAVWPYEVLVAECDPQGGDLAARFRLPPTPGLLSLGSVARRSLDAGDVLAATQRLPGGLQVLLGPPWAEQARALGRLWSALPPALAQLDADVLVDCGRLDPDSLAIDLVRQADLVVLGLGDEWFDNNESLGGLREAVAARTPVPILLVRRHGKKSRLRRPKEWIAGGGVPEGGNGRLDGDSVPAGAGPRAADGSR
jgi:hypothetical protein